MATMKKKIEVIRLPKRTGSNCYVDHDLVRLPDGRCGYLQFDPSGEFLFEGHEAAIYGVIEGRDYGGNVWHTRTAPESTVGVCAPPMRGALPILGAFGRPDTLIAYVDFV